MWKIAPRLRTLLFRSQYHLVNPRIVHSKWQYQHDKHKTFYPVLGFRDRRQATILLNKPHYNNKLSLECMDQMYRFFRSFDVDSYVNQIWFENLGRASFCEGIQYNDLINCKDYLHRLFTLGIMLSKINKPVLGYIKGTVGSTGGNLLSMLSHPFGGEQVHLVYNQIDHGWIPTIGGSFNLSRTKNALGLYLAMTGETINAEQMVDLKYIHALLRENTNNSRNMQRDAADCTAGLQQILPADVFETDLNTDELRMEHDFNKFQYNRLISRRQDEIITEENSKTRLTEHFIQHRNMMKANRKVPWNRFSNRQQINNYFRYRLDPIMSKFGEKYLHTHNKGNELQRFNMKKINQIFIHDTVEKIFSELEKDGSEWALSTLNILKNKNPLALKLTFRLLREGESSTFQQCLQREYRVASRLRRSEEFLNFYKTRVNTRTIHEVTEQQIESYFTKHDPQDQLQHDLRPYCLYPVKFYHEKIPDSVRFYLNKDFFNDYNRENQVREVDNWLNQNQINYRLAGFDVDKVREKVYMSYQINRRIQIQKERIGAVLYNPEELKRYKQKRIQTINAIFADQSQAKSKIEGYIKRLFKNRITQRFEDMTTTAENSAKQQKASLLSHIKDILIKKRLTMKLNQPSKHQKHTSGIIDFNDQGKGIFDSMGSYIENTPLGIFAKKIKQSGPFNLDLSKTEQAMLDLEVYERTPLEKRFTFSLQGRNQIVDRYGDYTDLRDSRYSLSFFEEAKKNSDLLKQLALKYSDEELEEKLYQETTFQRYKYKDYVRDLQKLFKKTPHGMPKYNVEEELTYEDLLDMDFRTKQKFTLKNNHKFPKLMFPQGVIPKQLQPIFIPLAETIHKGLMISLFDRNAWKWLEDIKDFDDYLNDVLIEDYNNFIMNDMLYIFCYFSIEKVSEIVDKASRLGVHCEATLSQFLHKHYGVQIPISEISNCWHNFNTTISRLYQETRQKLLFKNSKILETLNASRLAEIQLNPANNQQFDLQAFLITVGKQAAIMKNRIAEKPAVFGIETEHTRNLFYTQTDVSNADDDLDFELKNRALVNFEVYVDRHKQLISGFAGYLDEFEKISVQIMGNQNFLPEQLSIPKHLTDIPKYFEMFDDRRPYHEEIDQRIYNAIKLLFSYRLNVERRMSKSELLVFDSEFTKVLTPQTVKDVVEDMLEQDAYALHEFNRMLTESENQKRSQPLDRKTTYKIKNKKALKRLNNFFRTVMVENMNRSDDYDAMKFRPTLSRMIGELYEEEEPRSSWTQEELIKVNFTEMNKVNLTQSKLDKDQQKNTSNLSNQLRKICEINNEDQLFKDLLITL